MVHSKLSKLQCMKCIINFLKTIFSCQISRPVNLAATPNTKNATLPVVSNWGQPRNQVFGIIFVNLPLNWTVHSESFGTTNGWLVVLGKELERYFSMLHTAAPSIFCFLVTSWLCHDGWENVTHLASFPSGSIPLT